MHLPWGADDLTNTSREKPVVFPGHTSTDMWRPEVRSDDHRQLTSVEYAGAFFEKMRALIRESGLLPHHSERHDHGPMGTANEVSIWYQEHNAAVVL